MELLVLQGHVVEGYQRLVTGKILETSYVNRKPGFYSEYIYILSLYQLSHVSCGILANES